MKTRINWADEEMKDEIDYYAVTFMEYFDHHDATNDVILSTLVNMLAYCLNNNNDENVLDQSLKSIKFMYYEYEKRGQKER